MGDTDHFRRLNLSQRPMAMILGLNEIASAIAVKLHRAGYGVVMSHDPNPPVIRRGMAFFDALYGDPAVVDGLSGICADSILLAKSELQAHDHIVVTPLQVSDLLVLGEFEALIDARMQKRLVTPNFCNLARVTIGLGPGFTIGSNCDVAIETRPDQAGLILTNGATEPADGKSRILAGRGRERFVYSRAGGQWRTALDVGSRVFTGFPIGYLDGEAIRAPLDGIIRGIARDGIEVPASVKLVEVDPRMRKAQWTGLDERGRALAGATLRALRNCAHASATSGRGLRLVQP